MDGQSPVIFYYYPELSDSEFFCRLLEKRFRESGHTRSIEFREWDSYKELPPRDGDLYVYDAAVLPAMRKEGYFHELPDIIDVSDVFDWARTGTMSGKKLYGVPMMACCFAVICRRKDYEPYRNVFDLRGRVATHLRSLLLNYYLMSVCNNLGNREAVFDALDLLRQSMGDELSANSSHSRDDVANAFIDGSFPYFIGFTEMIRLFPKDDYVVKLANFSDTDENPFPMFLVDLVSLGNDVSGEKLLDCIDIMEIMADPDFTYDVCTCDGKLQYMLPVTRSTTKRLALLDPVYNQFYDMLDREDNCVLHFGKDYFDSFARFKRETLTRLDIPVW